MITEDFTLVKEIFSIIDVGIIEGYDSFCFEVEVGGLRKGDRLFLAVAMAE